MRNGETKTRIAPLKIFHEKLVLGAPEEGVNCHIFFDFTHVRGVGRWLLVL